MKHILLVDDDALLRRSLAFNLQNAGYRVSTAAAAEDALALAQRDAPHLILLDIGLPEMDGLDALNHFRQITDVPLIFLTARRRELDEVLGLELGADDYITKPFDFDVLQARIKTVLRRYQRVEGVSTAITIQVGGLILDVAAHTVIQNDVQLELSPREFDLLHALILEAGKVISTDDLLARVWGAEYAAQPQVVYVHIRWLRQKIEDNPNKPKHILTMRGVGYKYIA